MLKFFKTTFKLCIFLSFSFIVCMTLLYVYAYLSPGIDIKTSNSFYIYDNKET